MFIISLNQSSASWFNGRIRTVVVEAHQRRRFTSENVPLWTFKSSSNMLLYS
jgi:hypothetical protein